MVPGTRLEYTRSGDDGKNGRDAEHGCRHGDRAEMRDDDAYAFDEVIGHALDAQAEKIPELRACDQHGDAVGKPNDDGTRDVLDGRPDARRAEADQDDAGHHRANEQPVDAVLADDAGDDDHECAGRAANGRHRSAERCRQKSSNDGAVDAGLRRQPGRDGECHCKRQRDKPYGDACDGVGYEGVPVVLPQRDDGLGYPVLHGRSPV